MPGRDKVLLVTLLLLTAALRFAELDRSEIWIDEARSLQDSASFSGVFETLATDNKPPLYYLVLHVWRGVFGDSLVALRALSALFGTLLVATFWFLGSSIMRRDVARVAAAVAAIHPIAIHYSREGRNYAMLLLFATLAILTLERALQSRARRWWAAYAVSLSGTVLIQYLGLLLLPIALVQLAGTRSPRAWKAWLVSITAALAPLFAWWPIARRQGRTLASSLAWFEPSWASWEPLEPFLLSLRLLTPGGKAPVWTGFRASSDLQLPVLFLGIGLLVLFVRARSVAGEERSDSRSKLVIASSTAVPLVILWIGSHVAFPVYVVGRADLIALPGAILFITAALTGSGRRVFTGMAVVVIAVSGLTIAHDRATPDNGERQALEPFATTLRSDDVVICTNLTQPTAAYYFVRHGKTVAPCVSYPDEMKEHPAFFHSEDWTGIPGYLEREADIVDAVVRSAHRRGGRVFMLLVDDPTTRVLRRELSSRYLLKEIAAYRLNRVRIPVLIAEMLPR